MHSLGIPKIPLQDGSYLLIFAPEDLDGQQPRHQPLPAWHLLQILDIYPLALNNNKVLTPFCSAWLSLEVAAPAADYEDEKDGTRCNWKNFLRSSSSSPTLALFNSSLFLFHTFWSQMKIHFYQKPCNIFISQEFLIDTSGQFWICVYASHFQSHSTNILSEIKAHMLVVQRK